MDLYVGGYFLSRGGQASTLLEEGGLSGSRGGREGAGGGWGAGGHAQAPPGDLAVVITMTATTDQ